MQLPGDRVGPEQAEATCDIGRGRKRTSPPPKRSSVRSRRPRQPSPTSQRPKARAKRGGAHTQKGERQEKGLRAARARGGLAALPGTACRRPPLKPARLPQPPDASTPRAPIAQNEVGAPEGSEAGTGRTRLGGAGSGEAAAAAPGIKLAPARPSRRLLGHRCPRRWGRRPGAGAGKARWAAD